MTEVSDVLMVRFRCSHILKKVFGEFHLRAHKDFLDYFVWKWLEKEEIPVVVWSCYHRCHRTNNAVEGWNNKVNRCFERPQPNTTKSIGLPTKRSRKLQPLIHANYIKFRGGQRKKCYINLT
jgi:hypothetical protein